ncbi:ring finger protein 5 [Stylonychia lemnae]|uniref:RING-type E3 ubiquitin transferase n=1 Tax=Stylonychia lemnae TaxID=5949 RepID=A0A078APW4_STYLE|nr:ring finger protein 5 [Stylonychia lemnae]|eukprot:CDW83337.1 ring finger protein 5 [Stylonychia lemnae]
MEYSKLAENDPLQSSENESNANLNQPFKQNMQINTTIYDYHSFNQKTANQNEEEKKSAPSSGANKDHASAGSAGGAKFECNICLDIANEPVVSTCGHLYCWVCIFQWINQPKETLLCPVCKSGISKETLIPIYTKGSQEDPRTKAGQEVPKRPAGQRQGPVPNQNFNQGGGLFGNNHSGSGFVMGLGIFPALFTLNFNWDDIFGQNNLGRGNGANAANNEETREQQLQRLLLIFMFFMFMSFVFFGGDVFLTF